MLNLVLDMSMYQAFTFSLMVIAVVGMPYVAFSKKEPSPAIAIFGLFFVCLLTLSAGLNFQAPMNDLYANKMIENFKDEREKSLFKEYYTKESSEILKYRTIGFKLCEKSNYESPTCLDYLRYFEKEVKDRINKDLEQENEQKVLEAQKQQKTRENIEKLKL